ncbi:MAG: MamK family actin-like protein [candidate division KSB1 bacterium]|nr:MamK family actin-like protein [candidate division KSB1 bacterium]
MAEELKKQSKEKTESDSNVLYLGIDLGTSETTVYASSGISARRLSIVGWPKDLISRKLLGKDILFGEEVLKHKLALNVFRPLEKGEIKDTDGDLEAARELVKHVISLAKPKKYDKVYAVIGAPARSSFANQQALVDAAREVVDAVMIVSEPFAVAYGEGKIFNSLVIDIGAGTTDICCIKGTMPEDQDQVTILKAGDYIDLQLMESVKAKVEGAQITKDLAKKWKEQFSFVMEPEKPAVVELTIEGKPFRVDITKNIKESCESIVPEIAACARRMIASFDPEFQAELKQNILLAGGGSLIRNIDKLFALELRSLGPVKITRAEDPLVAGAKGALALAMDLTDEYWRAL